MIVDYELDHCHRLVALRSDKASARARPFEARPPGVPKTQSIRRKSRFALSRLTNGCNNHEIHARLGNCIGAAVVAIFAALPAQLLGNPQGGVVTTGSASISQSTPVRIDINQQSQKAIIDWRGFDIAPGEHTNFNHPSSTAVTLNRVNSRKAIMLRKPAAS